MKRFFLMCGLALVLLLGGCGLSTSGGEKMQKMQNMPRVETLKMMKVKSFIQE